MASTSTVVFVHFNMIGILQHPETRNLQIPDIKKKISSYLFTALGGHLGAALPVAGVATHCRQQNDTIRLTALLQPAHNCNNSCSQSRPQRRTQSLDVKLLTESADGAHN